MLSRRTLLKYLTAGSTVAVAPGLAFAKANGDARFVLTILRGAADGLAIAAPYADPDYRKLRGELALDKPNSAGGVLDLDGFFGLHPRLVSTHQRFLEREALLVHAVASPYRRRSHFDGQDVLESGGGRVGAMRDGWLNRALEPLGGERGRETAIALAQNPPLVLRGPESVGSWAPSRLADADAGTIDRLRQLYRDDTFFADRLEQALKSQSIATDMNDVDGRARRAEQLKANMTAAGRFLETEGGPRIAVVETGGWDTHANQGAANGALANQLEALDSGLAALHAALGEQWRNTVVVVVTEFGRTARVNGTRGTDHGTASAALVLGGAVNGGRVLGDWPGLGARDLLEARDLAPTADLRSVFKGVLTEHLGLASGYVDARVFPGSDSVQALQGIVRA
ncbi:MAG: DUF1501 domain-containing protein [Pseudomonadota bacterium]